jgi:hypothetical protein
MTERTRPPAAGSRTPAAARVTAHTTIDAAGADTSWIIASTVPDAALAARGRIRQRRWAAGRPARSTQASA